MTSLCFSNTWKRKLIRAGTHCVVLVRGGLGNDGGIKDLGASLRSARSSPSEAQSEAAARQG